MSHKVLLREQVKEFMERLAPESRRKIWRGLSALETEKGDCLPLREGLAGYHRLMIGGYRVIFRHLPGRVIECVFAEERSLVHHLFERDFMKHLRREAN